MDQQKGNSDSDAEVPTIDGYFVYSATLRIFGDNLDFDEIGKRLNLTPTHTHRKGERRFSAPYPHDMWSYSPPVDKFHALEEHINVLWSDIKGSKAYLLALKNSVMVDVFLGYRTDDPTAGIHVSHSCLAMFVELEVPFSLSIIVT